jgi:hypothetical protein
MVRREDGPADQAREITRVRTVPWWVGPAFAVLAVGTVPWVVFLAVSLPRHATFAHYRGVWVGFDIALIGVLATTAVQAWRGRPQVALAATAAATMLFVDAWFDVLTTPPGRQMIVSLILAGGVEIPLALICLWIARHAAQVLEARALLLARRAARAEERAAKAEQRSVQADQVSAAR